MLARIERGTLLIRSVDGTVQHTVDLGGLGAPSGLKLDPSGRWLAITAPESGGRAPHVNSNEQGDLRLQVIDLVSGARRRLGDGYANDASWWSA